MCSGISLPFPLHFPYGVLIGHLYIFFFFFLVKAMLTSGILVLRPVEHGPNGCEYVES